jgi:plastocyanin domain-containing protein
MNIKRLVIVLCVLALAAATASGSGRSQAAKARDRQDRKVQQVRLTSDDKGYVVTPSVVTRGVPVRMEVDLDTVKGCTRTVVISAFGVKRTVKPGDTAIEFTPTRAGKIEIVCGMNMVRGSFTVVEPGTK